jgi:hypothetical protein
MIDYDGLAPWNGKRDVDMEAGAVMVFVARCDYSYAASNRCGDCAFPAALLHVRLQRARPPTDRSFKSHLQWDLHDNLSVTVNLLTTIHQRRIEEFSTAGENGSLCQARAQKQCSQDVHLFMFEQIKNDSGIECTRARSHRQPVDSSKAHCGGDCSPQRWDTCWRRCRDDQTGAATAPTRPKRSRCFSWIR